MNLKKIGFLLIIFLGIFSCKEDTRTFFISQEEQNEIDDRALVKYLEEHYFDTDGTVKKFTNEEMKSGKYKPLSQFAEKDPSGYYIVKNENAQKATGRAIKDNKTDSILIQFDLIGFRAIGEENVNYLSYSLVSTVNDSGLPQWDPAFYKPSKDSKVNYEVKPFIDGLKKFKSLNKKATDTPYVDFQGVILVPSRLGYGRDFNPYKVDGTDLNLVLNFQIYQVVDRK